jgi:hypothetical protein
MTWLRLAAFVVLGLAVPAVAYADSDGYYCTGRGYLAFQFGMAPMPIAPHRVSVISLRGPQGIPEPAVLELPQFQVHGMLCGEGWIDIASFTMVYRITLDATNRPTRYEQRVSLKGQPIPQAFIQSQSQNLGPLGGARAYVKPIRIALGVRPLGGEYILEVIAKATEPVKPCEVSVTSRIVETDDAGQEGSTRIIFQGRGYRECGGGGLPAARPFTSKVMSNVGHCRFASLNSARDIDPEAAGTRARHLP